MSSRLLIYDGLPLTPAQYAGALAMVPEERRRKAGSYLSPLHRQLSVMAMLLLMHALGARSADLPAIVTDSCGKPRFSDLVLPRFNLSHCSLAVACATATGHEVGVDVEACDQYTPEVAARVCSPVELAAIDGDAGRFTRLWTRKESYLKWLGTGLTDDMRSIPPATAGCSIATYSSARGYACSVCSDLAPSQLPQPEHIRFSQLVTLTDSNG